MTIDTSAPRKAANRSNAETPIEPPVSRPALAEDRVLDYARGVGGWVAPDGLAPRAVFERLVERGLLEAWPNKPLYRARPAIDGGVEP